jgi:hypothetical protein
VSTESGDLKLKTRELQKQHNEGSTDIVMMCS